MSASQKPLVLLTGASGFVAAHILDAFLSAGFPVRGTVRSQGSADGVRRTHGQFAGRLEVVVVGDMASAKAYPPELFKGVGVVVHTATPANFFSTDPEKDTMIPAVDNVKELLKSVKDYAPQARRFIYTSSLAAVLRGDEDVDTAVISGSQWTNVTWEQGKASGPEAYRASKKFAELAVWDFIEREKPNFTATAIHPPLVLGAAKQHDFSRGKINLSTSLIWTLLNGSDQVGFTESPVFVHVEDVALAHLRAVERPEAAGKRYLVVGGTFQWAAVCDILKKLAPEHADKIPSASFATPVKLLRFDASAAERDLGIKFRSLEDAVTDAARSLLALK